MRVIWFLFLVSLFVSAEAGAVHYDIRDAPYLFLKFVKEQNRQYVDAKDVIEHQAAFVTNLLKINKLNAVNQRTTFDINNFSDFTEEELRHVNGVLTKSSLLEKREHKINK